MKEVRVWMNHWFSTAYHIINLLKADDKICFVVVGSNTDENCVYQKVCDEWVVEPSINTADEYVEYCLDFCTEHRIEVFIPRRNLVAISKRKKDFIKIGVKLLVEEDDTVLEILFDKGKTYQVFNEKNIGFVPKYFVVSDLDGFKKAYKDLKTPGNRVCIKYAIDEGATSFRVIDDNMRPSLVTSVGMKITYETAVKILSEDEHFKPLMVMPYLSGNEISVDCLFVEEGNHILIPRFKSNTRSETIVFDKTILDMANKFLDTFQLKYPCNLQFKYEGEIPYFLEVNTRMSGGIQFSCKAVGINIPNLAVNRLLGNEKRVTYDKKTKIVSYVEEPIVLEWE